jgi:hypothetical protein
MSGTSSLVDPRRSTIDIVQAVGRAIRKSPDKKLGTIVLPVFLSEGEDPDQARRVSLQPFRPHTSHAPTRAHAQDRRGQGVGDWAPAFLAALRDTGMVSQACEAAGVGRRTVYDRRARDRAFALAWADELERAVEVMEAEAYRRAVHGVERPVTIAGQRELVREHSDRLLLFLLRARRPEVYGDRHLVEHGGRLDLEHSYNPDAIELSPALRARVRRILDIDDER